MLMNRILIWLGETFASRKKLIINDPCGAGPYLTRYYLIGARRSKYALMLHHIHRSDLDRDLHDHPWPFWSLILMGGYFEETPVGAPWSRRHNAKWYKPLTLLKRRARWTHRIRLDPHSGPVWTLVLRSEQKRDWGFWTPAGWVSYSKYDYKAGCE